MKSVLKLTLAVACGSVVGGGCVEWLHAQSRLPAFEISEIAFKNEEGRAQNFLKPAQKDVADRGPWFHYLLALSLSAR
jgi:hypothetical protein